jgi:hypothetical protein
MGPKIYLLVYDTNKNPDVLPALHRYIMDSKDFVGYWNYIPFVYIMKSYETLPVLREKFGYILTNGGFMLAEIFTHGVDGLLPREAWDWFWHSHGQLSIADVLQQQLGEKKNRFRPCRGVRSWSNWWFAWGPNEEIEREQELGEAAFAFKHLGALR